MGNLLSILGFWNDLEVGTKFVDKEGHGWRVSKIWKSSGSVEAITVQCVDSNDAKYMYRQDGYLFCEGRKDTAFTGENAGIEVDYSDPPDGW